MEIELGLIAAVALAGTAIQLRVLHILKSKLAEINAEEQKQEAMAEEKAVKRFEHVQRDLDEWEKEHGNKTDKTIRSDSQMSAVPLMKDPEDPQPSTPGGDSTVVGLQRTRTRSGLSDYGLNDASRPLSRFSQPPGLLPAMNLGLGLDSELPNNLVPDEVKVTDPELLQKESLLAEIQTIRRSIDALRSEGDSLSNGSRHHSMSLHSRTLSGDLAVAQAQAAASKSGLPNAGRERTRSMDLLDDKRLSDGAALGRSSSTPLKANDEEWEAYLRERKLFQPPSGPTSPIAPTYIAPIPRPTSHLVPVPDAVAEAIATRKQRESLLDPSSLNDQGRENRKSHRRTSSLGAINILPPKPQPKPEPPVTSRTHTYEELLERHQQKMKSLQAPLSRKEKEEVELATVRAQWERRQAAEKAEMARKQAEKEATLARKNKEEKRRSKGNPLQPEGESSRPRSMNMDHLGVIGGSGKRASTAKVQEWQKYQEVATSAPPERKDASTRSHRPNEQGVGPFPNTTPPGMSTTDRRRSRLVPRDPPS